MKKFLLLILISLFFFSCSTTKDIPKKLPPGNLNLFDSTANTKLNEMAPVQLPTIEAQTCEAYNREFLQAKQGKNDGILSSSQFISQALNKNEYNQDAIEYLTKSIESISFINEERGFVAFSHPPSPRYADSKLLPLKYESGGTDIFKFKLDNGTYIFENFEAINSFYWDSHPHVATDTINGKCISLLLWASDKDLPYSYIINLQNDTIVNQNTDIYYAFLDEDYNLITEIRKFSPSINSSNNEGTPFIYCLCYKPRLFFTSNRDNNPKNFDIYYSELEIDFDNLIISEVDKPIRISSEGINTLEDERFPFVANPIKEIGTQNTLYFSSNRFRRGIPNEKKDSIIENIGGFDIYKFNLPPGLDCPKPEDPIVKLNITLLDALEPDKKVVSPVITVREKEGEVSQYNDTNIEIELSLNSEYEIYGGSFKYGIDCSESQDSILKHYFVPADTSYFGNLQKGEVERLEKSNSASLTEYEKIISNSKEIIENTEIRNGDTVKVTYTYAHQYFPELIKDSKVNYIQKTNITPTWTDIQKNYLPEPSISEVYGANVPSEWTRNNGISTSRVYKDITIYDTIYVIPNYFHKPPCGCDFNTIIAEYNRNVPYFQTGYWEVNTNKNFNYHYHNKLQSSKYKEAKWIELHENNRYFGKQRKGRQARVYEYEDFSLQVDQNIDKISNVIGDMIIPTFEQIDSLSGMGKLVINIEAWSDKRPVERGWYIGDKIQYYEGGVNSSGEISISKVEIENMNNLNRNNDTLSKLRAYFGYKEVISKLKEKKEFRKFLDKDLVLLPDKISSKEDFFGKLETAKIIVLTKGMYYDPADYKIAQYIKGRDSTYYMLDTIRRIDVFVDKMQYSDGKLVRDECCNPDIDCLDYFFEQNDMSSFYINFGEFADKEKAKNMLSILYSAMIEDATIHEVVRNGNKLFRVSSSIYSNKSEASKVLKNYSTILKDAEVGTKEFSLELISNN